MTPRQLLQPTNTHELPHPAGVTALPPSEIAGTESLTGRPKPHGQGQIMTCIWPCQLARAAAGDRDAVADLDTPLRTSFWQPATWRHQRLRTPAPLGRDCSHQ